MENHEAVSRETLDRVFSDRLDLAEEFAQLLATDGLERGLLGPREVPRLWERHILNCAVAGEFIAADADVLDIGSGAGLPGIPLAISRPDLFVTLVEPMERRSAFLSECVARLSLNNVAVLRCRGEDVEPQGKADVVTCRAVATIDKLVDWCLELARPDGYLLAIKGASAPAELEKHRKAIRHAGGDRPEVLQCGEFLSTPTTVMRIRRR